VRLRHAASRGFTLIELLVAATLLAVLAVLSWRGLDTVLASRDRLAAASDELRSLTLAFAQLDEDLRRSWPVRLLRLPVPAIGFSVAGERAVPTLEIVRETTGALLPTQVQRVAWRLRDGVLERGFGAWVSPDGGASVTVAAARSLGPAGGVAGRAPDVPADTLVWQPVLANVSALQMQGWIDGQGWIAAEALAGQLRGTASATGSGPAAGGGAPPPASSGASAVAPGGAAGQATAAGAAVASPPAVTGLLVRVVRSDGTVLQRILPVRD
jgi:general secretion pathway protein J